MTVDAIANFAYSTVAVAPNPAGSGTTLTVQSGQGALFPATPFDLTMWPAGVQPLASNAEIARCTNVSGDVLTITRGQYGTSGLNVVAGFQVAQNLTKNLITQIESITGAQGYQGYQGAQGTQGHQGYQGGQGLTGAQGTQGVQGAQGSQGPQGAQGSQGTTGNTGATGSQGIQGTQGYQGNTGPQGNQGTQGVQGAQGSQGPQGAQGSTGAQGATGAQGNQGFQGAPNWPPSVDTLTVSSNAVTVPVTYQTANITNNAAGSVAITLTVSGAVANQTQLLRFYDYSSAAQTLTFVNTENSSAVVPSLSRGSTTLPLNMAFIFNGVTSLWTFLGVS